MAEGANAIVTAMTTGATAISTSFVSLVASLIESPFVIGLLGIALAFGLFKFVMHRIPGLR